MSIKAKKMIWKKKNNLVVDGIAAESSYNSRGYKNNNNKLILELSAVNYFNCISLLSMLFRS